MDIKITDMTISEQLKTQREKQKLSLEDLVTRTELSIDTIRRIESGKNLNPTIYVIRKLSEALNFYKFEL